MDDRIEKKIGKAARRLEETVKRQFGVRYWTLKRDDEIRCLRLEQWEEKYRLSLEEILNIVVPVWKQKFARYTGAAFGVKIPTLVGHKSEEILKGKIAELFPEQENIKQWQVREQNRQWTQYREGIRQKEDWEHPSVAVRDYQQRMLREREARKKFAQIARQRPYRGNPWIG